MAAFYYGLLFLGRKCLHATSQKRALWHAISLAVNYRLFSHGDVSYRFNGKNDNVVLESKIKIKGTCKNRLSKAVLASTHNLDKKSITYISDNSLFNSCKISEYCIGMLS